MNRQCLAGASEMKRKNRAAAGAGATAVGRILCVIPPPAAYPRLLPALPMTAVCEWLTSVAGAPQAADDALTSSNATVVEEETPVLFAELVSVPTREAARQRRRRRRRWNDKDDEDYRE